MFSSTAAAAVVMVFSLQESELEVAEQSTVLGGSPSTAAAAAVGASFAGE